MKTLIVEDSTERLKRIMSILSKKAMSIDIAFTSDEAKELLISNTYDVVFLDHDLNPEHYEQQCTEETGQDVAKYIVENKLPIKVVFVHSLNAVGAEAIFNILHDANYSVKKIPFFWNSQLALDVMYDTLEKI